MYIFNINVKVKLILITNDVLYLNGIFLKYLNCKFDSGSSFILLTLKLFVLQT